jgi:hypothetical protein
MRDDQGWQEFAGGTSADTMGSLGDKLKKALCPAKEGRLMMAPSDFYD